MADSQALTVLQQEADALAVRREGSIAELVARTELIQKAMRLAMKPGVHFGKIKGIEKPSLFQPGAEFLDTLFRLKPTFIHTERWDGQHLTVVTEASITHLPTSEILAEGVSAICSTYESKYRWRQLNRRCPQCDAEALVKSKKHKGKWQCIGADKGGCWATFDLDDDRITTQEVGRKENEDLADQWETVIRMSEKRAHVAVTRMATAASDVFTQDVEEQPGAESEEDSTVDYETGEIRTQQTSGAPKPGSEDRNTVMSQVTSAPNWDRKAYPPSRLRSLSEADLRAYRDKLTAQGEPSEESPTAESLRVRIEAHAKYDPEMPAVKEVIDSGDVGALTDLLKFLDQQ